MDKDEYMTRNEWVVQFLFALMTILVAGLALDFGLKLVIYPAVNAEMQASLDLFRIILPSPTSSLGLLFGFIYALVAFFIMGAMKPKRRRPVRV